MDYFMIMESRINYFEKKYDPERKYGFREVTTRKQEPLVKNVVHKKILAGFSYLFSILF